VDVRALSWVGLPTPDHAEARRFLVEVLGLEPWVDREDFTVADLPNGDRIELFGPTAVRPHMTGPIIGLLVDDVEAARAELETRGVEFLEPTGSDPASGASWAHFRGPGGWLFQLTGNPAHPAAGG
jgi:catechol 2,3-dioxygenase-like lactoylglutathione lyase family enzyme